MLTYYLGLARTRLLETKGMTLALVLALGLGIGASVTMLTVVRAMSWDPLPGRSGQLFHPFLDPLPAGYQIKGELDPRVAMTWPDASELLRNAPAQRQTVLAAGRLLVDPQPGAPTAFFVDGQYTNADAAAMFDMEVLQGRWWSADDDLQRSRVVVVSRTLAQRLGHGSSLVGRTLQLDGQPFRVVGVIADWVPRPRFHTDLQQEPFKGRDDVFIPLQTAVELQLRVANSMYGWSGNTPTNRMLDASTAWVQLWAEIPDPAGQQAYLHFLQSYVQDQHARGRFDRQTPPHLDGLRGYLVQRRIIPDEVRLQLALCLAFLAVCLVNMGALIFARFVRRTHEIAVRRALGARRRDIILQLCTEALMIGLLGGGVGLLVSQAGLFLVRMQPEDYASLAVIDPTMVIATPVLACIASLFAAVLPALRAASTRVAMQIKAAE